MRKYNTPDMQCIVGEGLTGSERGQSTVLILYVSCFSVCCVTPHHITVILFLLNKSFCC